MKLKRSLPPNRNFEQVMNHYLVEKSIAEKLKKSNIEERKLIYATMYDELFNKVPDHPRLVQRHDDQLTFRSNTSKMVLVKRYFDKSAVFAEFAPGDCRFVMEVSRHFKWAYGIDISDQRNPTDNAPENFKLIIYDGFNLNEIEQNCIDIMFSDQLIEHLHPEDCRHHFKLVHSKLKPGGKYIFRTPHAYRGPSDVSGYFSDEPEGFHLKEWTYMEINALLKDIRYSSIHSFWNAKGINIRTPYIYYKLCEKFLILLPKRYLRYLARYLLPGVIIVAVK
jgi:hypothetical protein